MSRRSGLGRGLAALIPPAPRPDSEASSDATPDDADAEAVEGGDDDEGVRLIEGPGQRVAGAPAAQDDASGEPSDAGEQAPMGEVHPEQSAGTIADSPPPPPPPASASSGAADPAVGVGDVSEDAASDRASVPATTATLEEVALERIVPNPAQPREVFDPEELEGLATSLRDVGVLQPLVVRPAADGAYQLIAGERRWRAAQLAGLDRVPVVVRHTDDADLLKEALVENIHRVQLNPLEEAAAYQQLLEEFDVTQEELAGRLGKSRPSISNAIRLLGLPAAVQRRVAAGVLSAGHAKVLLALDDATSQSKIAERIVAEGLSVRATEELVRLRLLDEPAPRSRSRRPPTAPGLIELQEDLSDALEARVRISMGARKGKVAIEFGSVDDLERIVAVIAGGISQSRSTPNSPEPEASPGD